MTGPVPPSPFTHPIPQEVEFLRRRDSGKGRIDFVDIASPSYDPDYNAGISYEQVHDLSCVVLMVK